jgi:hypothetical protein
MFTLWDDASADADGALRLNKAYPLKLPGIETVGELLERLRDPAAKDNKALLTELEKYRLLWAKGPYARLDSVLS